MIKILQCLRFQQTVQLIIHSRIASSKQKHRIVLIRKKCYVRLCSFFFDVASSCLLKPDDPEHLITEFREPMKFLCTIRSQRGLLLHRLLDEHCLKPALTRCVWLSEPAMLSMNLSTTPAVRGLELWIIWKWSSRSRCDGTMYGACQQEYKTMTVCIYLHDRLVDWRM